MTKTAVIGAGLIGRSWAMVFARAGYDVALWDPVAQAVPAALEFITARLPELAEHDLLRGSTPEAVIGRMHPAASLEDAVAGAEWVQENGPERLDAKRDLFARLDRAAPAHCILASSTSTIPPSEFGDGLAGRARVLVAHPVNPPYLVPVVELSPAPFTDPDVVQRARAFMEGIGMVPATVQREVQGFILNRLQAALLGEAFRLVEDGIATPEDVDATIKHGLGLRWAFMGPFETIDLNAPGGLADYCARFGTVLHEMQQQMAPRPWHDDLVRRLHAERRVALPDDDHAERQAWRDRRLMALLAHKAAQPG
jgi:L-gulonate 3-dehydrogenase